MDQLTANLITLLNERDRKLASVNIWEHSDAEEIVRELIAAKYIKKCRFPWKGKITFQQGQQPVLLQRERLRHLLRRGRQRQQA